jgi:hypothetical protein
MAQSDADYLIRDPVSPRVRRPLAVVMALDVVVMLLAWVAITFVVQFLFVSTRAGGQGVDPANIEQVDQFIRLIGADGIFVTALLQNIVFLTIPMLRIAVLRREPLAQIGFRAQSFGRLLLFGVGLGFAMLMSNAVIGAVFQSFGMRQNQAQLFPLFPGDYLGQALFFIAVVVFAPIGEETLFRGYMFNAIHRTFQERPWALHAAYLVSAFVFAVVHSMSATEGQVALVAPLFVAGLILAWGMHRTGSLIPCIVAHAFNNGLGITVLLTCINDPNAAHCLT